jgi:hypothetical protein
MTTTIKEPGADPRPAEPGAQDPRAERARTRWWRRPWVGPLIMAAVIFVAFAVPPYLTGDPSRSRVPTHPELGWYYPVLVAHIVFGSIALLTSGFQIWRWFRRRYPAAHRWLGRAYFFLGVFPAGVGVLLITPHASTGIVSIAANLTLALLWLPVSIAGYRMARQRRFREHRRWMIRSFALTWTIVTDRIWGPVMLILISPQSLEAQIPHRLLAADDHTGIAAIGIANFLSLIVNLLIAEWWLERSDFAVPNRARRAARTAH